MAGVGPGDETAVEGGLAAAGVGAVDNIVVYEGEAVEKLEAAGDAVGSGSGCAGVFAKELVGGEEEKEAGAGGEAALELAEGVVKVPLELPAPTGKLAHK